MLSDAEKRSMYDRYGTDMPPGFGGTDFGGMRDPFDISLRSSATLVVLAASGGPAGAAPNAVTTSGPV